MKKVLITGCSGFLAQHIVPAFQKAGYYVIGVDKRPLDQNKPDKFIQADVMDLNFRDMMGVDYVVHLAWRTNIPDCVRHPRESTHQNIDMTLHLLELAKEAGIEKFLFPSTASQYGHNPTPWTEDMNSTPIEHYSWQKRSCEIACQMYSEAFDLDTIIFRFFQVFGEYQREDTALSAFFRLKKEGKPITLTKTMAQSAFKSGQRDFVYAGDLAWALVQSVLKDVPAGEILNVASGEYHTMEDIANAVGGKVKWIPRREYEVERHHGDINKIQKMLDWGPTVNVIEWIHENNS